MEWKLLAVCYKTAFHTTDPITRRLPAVRERLGEIPHESEKHVISKNSNLHTGLRTIHLSSCRNCAVCSFYQGAFM